MKFSLTPLFLYCLIGSPVGLHSQSSDQPPVYTSMLHLSTDSGKYKGRIIEMTDSTVSIMLLKNRTRMDFDARHIYTIKVKKRFFRSVLLDCTLGAVAATFVVVSYYWREGFYDPDLSFGQALLGGLAIGGGGGLVYGMAESTFFRVHIPVNKSLDVFRLHRRRLLKFWLGNE